MCAQCSQLVSDRKSKLVWRSPLIRTRIVYIDSAASFVATVVRYSEGYRVLPGSKRSPLGGRPTGGSYAGSSSPLSSVAVYSPVNTFNPERRWITGICLYLIYTRQRWRIPICIKIDIYIIIIIKTCKSRQTQKRVAIGYYFSIRNILILLRASL